MSLKILITNDDGIDAIGLSYLVEHAKKYGEVTVVAPKIEQSAKSQSINIRESFKCEKIDKFDGVLTYQIDSTPTDCIRYAKYGLHLDYDLVLAGINKGYNIGEDIWYSATVSVCYEAVSTKAKAISFSVIKSSNEGYKYFARYGKGKVFSAAQGIGAKSWHMKRQKLSARPTTRWDELMTVR